MGVVVIPFVDVVTMGEAYFPGATTLGVACKDGVIIASEKKVTLGYFVVSKSGRKVFKLTDNIAAACAGLMGDMQILMREIVAYTKLYELENGRSIAVRSAAKLLSTILFQRRYYPYITQTIVGGVDDEGSSIYTLDPFGSVLPDKYAAVGTGAEVAVGVLEASYKDGLSLNECRELVLKAMRSAFARDATSGNGIDLILVTKEGIKEETLSA
ncbi:archaeal proteasome endopeptidase complex subunit beta [Candidatus Bathyarchaeota archaeon]|nr:archaeal proteasome endopeptidase complex subunit beta [Candidatus Bathyarchaeota archaeon]